MIDKTKETSCDSVTDTHHCHAVHHAHKPIEQQLAQIETYCASQGLRFTKLRKQVLSLILEAERPIGAYDILAKLKHGSKPAAPPTVYRSLDFLLSHGFIHRLASMNAYIACCHPREQHEAAFLICENCDAVQEFSKKPLFDELHQLLKKDGFVSKHTTVEISGLCRRCANEPDLSRSQTS